METLLRQLHEMRDTIERASVPAQRTINPWPIASAPDFANGVLMSDGPIQTFRSYGRAMSFIEHNPAPTPREQLAGSKFAEQFERDQYRWDEETNDRDFGEVE